jgi:hypothetical protein
MWCPAPLPEGELHQRKLRSDKHIPPASRLLEFYEFDSSVEADEDTDVEVGGNTRTGPDAGGAGKSQLKTWSAAAMRSVSVAAATVYAVKATEKKKTRKRKATSPPVVVTPSIPTPRSREVEWEEEEEEDDEAIEESPIEASQSVRRSESPAAKRQWELVEKTPEDTLRRGLEAQRTATTTQARMPAAIRPRLFRPKPRVPVIAR